MEKYSNTFLTLILLAAIVIMITLNYVGDRAKEVLNGREVEKTKERLEEYNTLNRYAGKKVKNVNKIDDWNLLIEFEDGTRLKVKSCKYTLQIN